MVDGILKYMDEKEAVKDITDLNNGTKLLV